MVYLPPASWWRFVGWLVLGAAIYCRLRLQLERARPASRTAGGDAAAS